MKEHIAFLIITGFILSCGAKQEEALESKPELEVEHPTPQKPAKPHESEVVEIDGATAQLVIFGWSADSRFFAFGQRGNRADPLDTEYQGFGEFWLVEVAEDKFVNDVSTEIFYTEVKPVTPEDIDKVQKEFGKKIKPYDIKGSVGAKLKMKVLDNTGDTERVEFKTVDGEKFIATLVQEINYEAYPCEGRFELVLENSKTGRKVTLQKAGKFYMASMAYDIHSAYVDPTGKWIAVFTLKTLYGFEGSGIPSFMVNTGRLP
jgi:predicted secreted protein